MCLTEPDVDAENLYQILGLNSGATNKQICAAYKRLALKYHPDKNPDQRDKAEHAFKRVTCAYETLRDSAKRNEYDRSCRKIGSCPLGSSDRSDELYNMFFGGSNNINSMDIAGIFNFDSKPRAKQPKVAARPVRPSNPTHLLMPGTPVVIHSLAKTPEYNGKSAKVREWNASKGRYEVMSHCGSMLSLRPQNLTQLCHVTVASHPIRPELDAKCAEIVDFNSESGHYVLLLHEPAAVVELSARHCIFPAGTAGVLQGLSDEKLNGQMCSIVGIDHDTSRYLVECEGGRQLKVRFERILC